MELNENNVIRLFNECIYIEKGKKIILVIRKGFEYEFDKETIEKNTLNISSMISQVQTYERKDKVSKSEKFHVIVDMFKNEKDEYWTISGREVCYLGLLGIAAGLIKPLYTCKFDTFYLLPQ